MWSSRLARYMAFALALLFPAAAFPNHPQSEYDPKVAPLIGVALSGGGLRAAAFSHGVMLELRKLCLTRPQEQSSPPTDHDNHENHSPFYSLHYLEDAEYSNEVRENPCGQGGGASFLDNVHYLSGVSGGAITAAYYKTHPKQLTEFGQKLKDARLGWKLFTGEKATPVWRPPLMLFASMLDTLFQTFKLPLLPIPEIEVVPFATMALYDGLFESEQLAPVYRDLFLDKTTFGDLERLAKRGNEKGIGQTNLLINATDIANGRILTFDKETFACLGKIDDFRQLQLSIAVAASSSLPGVFSPLHLKSLVTGTDSKRIPTSCPLILGDQIRSPILVDGGVSDNLGVTGLLRTIFERKNKNNLPKDDSTSTQGQALELSEGEELEVTSSKLAPKSLSSIQFKNPKAQKTFLLIVNAGVTANSSLPRLAGHLDNSFDVLIRDRTDLSRVIAQRMLGNFGFGVVEVNMRDLVKSSRVVSRVVKLALANHRTPKLTDEPIRQIAQTFDFAEMERKVLDDLNQIGFLPSKDEIDTLILAGRAVVAEMSGLIKQEYETLVDKNYSASCENIVNPSRHYCWPSSFETPHLAANKVGVLLDVLTRTSEEFSRRVSENQSNQLAQAKRNLINFYLDESRALEEQMELLLTWAPVDKEERKWEAKNWKTIQTCYIQRDKEYSLVRRGEWGKSGSSKNEQVIPVCSLEVLNKQNPSFLANRPGWLFSFPHLEVAEQADSHNNVKESLERYVSNLLDPDALSPNFSETHKAATQWGDKVIRHMMNKDNAEDPTPTYYAVLSKFLMLRHRYNEGFHYLYEGATKFPYDPELSYLLGYYSIHINRDFQGGLTHFASAIEKAESNKQQVALLPRGSDDKLEEENRETLQNWFSRAADRYSLRSAKFAALSPIPLHGRSEFVSNEAVDAWLNQTFPDGHGGNDLSTLLSFAEQSKSVPQSMISTLGCRIQKTIEKASMSFTDTVKVSINDFLKAYDGDKCQTHQSGDISGISSLHDMNLSTTVSCRDIQEARFSSTGDRPTPCQLFGRVQNAIRKMLALPTAVTYARAQARKLYESHTGTQVSTNTQRTYPPYLWERADVYGMIFLLDAIQKECPRRTDDVRMAQRLFHVAAATISNGEDGRLKEHVEHVEFVKTRIRKLQDAADELACNSRHMD